MRITPQSIVLPLCFASHAHATEYNPSTYLPSAAPQPARTGEIAADLLLATGGSSAVYLRGAYAANERLRFGASLGVVPAPVDALLAPPSWYWVTLMGQYALLRGEHLNLAAFVGGGYLLIPSYCLMSCGTIDDIFGMAGLAVEGPLAADGRLRFDASVPIVLSDYFGNFDISMGTSIGRRALVTLQETELGASLHVGERDRLRIGKSLGLSADARWTHVFGPPDVPAWFAEVEVAGGYQSLGFPGGAMMWGGFQWGRSFGPGGAARRTQTVLPG